jgi:hypothetical protein
MSRESGNQFGMLEQQLDHDRRMRVIDRMHDLIAQGSKGLAILNGGAVVAMLAFVQAMVDKPAYRGFKPFALGALSCFLFGAFLSAITFFFHHMYINHAFIDSGRQQVFRKIVWGIQITSAACAFIGGALVAAGIWVAV